MQQCPPTVSFAAQTPGAQPTPCDSVSQIDTVFLPQLQDLMQHITQHSSLDSSSPRSQPGSKGKRSHH
eukprot:3925425-Rhodomonas_salina.1